MGPNDTNYVWKGKMTNSAAHPVSQISERGIEEKKKREGGRDYDPNEKR